MTFFMFNPSQKFFTITKSRKTLFLYVTVMGGHSHNRYPYCAISPKPFFSGIFLFPFHQPPSTGDVKWAKKNNWECLRVESVDNLTHKTQQNLFIFSNAMERQERENTEENSQRNRGRRETRARAATDGNKFNFVSDFWQDRWRCL